VVREGVSRLIPREYALIFEPLALKFIGDMALFIGFGIFCVLVLIGVVLWLEVRTLSERVRLFKMALESNQKKLDTQNSKLNILSNALPHLQSAILQKPDAEGWRVLVLDETRALLRADGASYWAYAEDRHLLECDVARGLESNPQGQVVQLASSEEDLVECAKSRISVVKNDESVASEAKRTLCVPMEIAGRLAGVFRFVRHGGEAFHTRDADMVLMFMKQVALCIENRDMVNHRETFYLELVQTLADILDAKDASMEGHTRRMRSLARAIGRELHMPDEFIYYLEFAALMHDIGKIGIDESLLKKTRQVDRRRIRHYQKTSRTRTQNFGAGDHAGACGPHGPLSPRVVQWQRLP
jgi:HD-GYP domain-containing protein (c-di-GMP phosphodiesterase class II)